MSVTKAETDYLKMFKISDRRYLIGVFQEGITVYKQQVRSLNLLYALVCAERISAEGKIAVIGGGVAGLTITSAALKLGLKVTLFEQKSIYLHVQYGCDTRKVHPNIYDWPDKDSLFPYADIPVLSWKYDTASKVSKQLFAGFNRIFQEKKDNISEVKSCTITKILEKPNCVEIDWSNEENGSDKFEIVIYATGYGIEEGVESEKYTPSYWRNDDYAQLRLTNKAQKYLISGTGDGGLIDLFRLKIFAFSQDSLIKDLSSNQENYNILTEKLDFIKNKWLKVEDSPPENWLHDEFSKIDSSGLLAYFKKILKHKIKFRLENEVILNGNELDFKNVLSLNKGSLLSSLLAYCLYKIRAFTYLPGLCTLENGHYKINDQPVESSQIVIVRHGTQRDNILKYLFVSEDEITDLQEKQGNNYSYNIVKRLWPSGWWSSNFIQKEGEDYKPFIEFFTPDTQSVCTSFVSVLSKVLEYFHLKLSKKKKDFRVTLHRVINIQDELYFQQITNYFGSKRNIIGEVGRVFPIKGGAAGYSARTGKTIIMERKDSKDFKLLTDELELDTIRARSLDEDVSSLLTMPIFAITSNGKLSTNLILYIDSSEDDFFEQDEDIIPLISKCAMGFIESISGLLETNQISMSQITFDPIEIKEEPELQGKLEKNQCFKNVAIKHSQLEPNNSELKFDIFHSFNIIFEYENDPFQ